MKRPLHQEARRKGATQRDIAELMRFRDLLRRGFNLANYAALYPEDLWAAKEYERQSTKQESP